MRTAVYENNEANFVFALADVTNILEQRSDQGVQQATELKNALSLNVCEVIVVDADYFGFVMLDLLKEGKGSVHCKICGSTHLANEVRSVPIGTRRNTITIDNRGEHKKGIIRKLFEGKKRITTMMGGERFMCPNGHALLHAMTGIE